MIFTNLWCQTGRYLEQPGIRRNLKFILRYKKIMSYLRKRAQNMMTSEMHICFIYFKLKMLVNRASISFYLVPLGMSH